MSTVIFEDVESILINFGNAFKDNPLDFLTERDVKCYLYQEFRGLFSNRVPVDVDLEKNMASRVHTELKFDPSSEKAIDVIVMEDRSVEEPYEVELKKKGEIRNFRPPFLIGIEVKKTDSFRYFQPSSTEISGNIEKLADCDLGYRYVVVFDFHQNKIADKNRNLEKLCELADSKGVMVFYAGLERFGFLPELIS